LRGEGIKVLINEGFRFEARGAAFWLGAVDDHMAAKLICRRRCAARFPMK
jgi:hypothetical protein